MSRRYARPERPRLHTFELASGRRLTESCRPAALYAAAHMDLELSEEHRLIRETVRRVAREVVAPRAAEIGETDEYPQDIFEAFGDLGLLGLTMPTVEILTRTARTSVLPMAGDDYPRD